MPSSPTLRYCEMGMMSLGCNCRTEEKATGFETLAFSVDDLEFENNSKRSEMK